MSVIYFMFYFGIRIYRCRLNSGCLVTQGRVSFPRCVLSCALPSSGLKWQIREVSVDTGNSCRPQDEVVKLEFNPE